MTDTSPAWDIVRAIAIDGIDALDVIDGREAAALAYDWRAWWSRGRQRIADGAWRSHGFLAGRGWGKTVANVGWLIERIVDRRIRRLNLIGPTDEEAYVVGFEDPFGGLEAWSPPWCKPTYSKNLITWPNGVECRIFGAYKPSRIRGGGLDAVWCTELQSWQPSTAIEAWDMAVIKTREGADGHGCKILWDATSERRNAIIGDRLREHEEDPVRYPVVRGDTRENSALPADYVRDLLLRYSVRDEQRRVMLDARGQPVLTQRGEEEIAAAYSLDTTGALWRARWIRHREPATIVRRVISIDPAFSAERGSDTVGICDAALDEYGQLVVMGDYSAKMRWESWGDLAIDLYLAGRCDCLVVERNKGGDAVAANVRARAAALGARRADVALEQGLAAPKPIRVVTLAKAERAPRHDPSVIYVREITSRDSKWNRAEPVASLYEAGLAYHVADERLRQLELTLCTWEPGPGVRSPGDMDALTQAAHELCDLAGAAKPRAIVSGVATVQRTAAAGVAARSSGASAVSRAAIGRVRGWTGSRV